MAWGLVAGVVWLAAGLPGNPAWREIVLAGLYLLAVLSAVCAIDARYGIVPDSPAATLALGGVCQGLLDGLQGLLKRELEAVDGRATLFRASYRWIRGFDGLGFGDVKFLAAAARWAGISGMAGLSLGAVLSAMVSLLIMRAEGHVLDGQQAI